MARKALPSGSLDRLIDEVQGRRGSGRSARKATRSLRRRQGPVPIDPLFRFAQSRGIRLSGPVGAARLAFQLAVELREVAQSRRIGWLSALSRAVAEYVTREDDR